MSSMKDSESNAIKDCYGFRNLLSEKAKYQSWLDVELSLAQAQYDLGIIPENAFYDIKKYAKLENMDFEEMKKIKEEIGHGFMPFVKTLAKACGIVGGKYIHYGVTTQNIQQSAQLLIVKKFHEKLKKILGDILENLSILAEEHKFTIMPGRTHGRHAIPITYGYKVSVWISDLLNSIDRLEESSKRTFQIMMGGAVGSYNTFKEDGELLQKKVAEILNMGAMDVPSRNITSHKTEYIFCLALLCSQFHKIAEEVYTTSLEEIGEVSEQSGSNIVGSSTMPHKINPKLSKGIIANAQKLYTLPQLCLSTSSSPYEANSSQYMLFENTFEEALELTIEVILRTEKLTQNIEVNKERMQNNTYINKGLDNTEALMMKLAEKIGKNQAHEIMHEVAMKVQNENKDLISCLMEYEAIYKEFSSDYLKEVLEPSSYIGQSAELANTQAIKANYKAKMLKN